MLLHGELRWLYAYSALLLAGAVASALTLPFWAPIAVAVGGLPIVFFFWMWQVGRFG